MDLRIQKTRQNIFQAFIELREKYPLEKITVKELTERAQISKQTFYLHYRDMYDLSERIEQSMIQEMLKELPYPENILTHTGEVTKQLFQKAIDQGHNFRIVFSGSRVSALTEGLETSLKNALYEKCPKYRTDLRANILITILVQGCYHAYEQYSTRIVLSLSSVKSQMKSQTNVSKRNPENAKAVNLGIVDRQLRYQITRRRNVCLVTLI